MKLMLRTAAVTCALMCTTANATMFDFSYSFSNGGVLTGSLNGTLDGSLIENVSNVHLSFAGFPYDQQLFSGTVTPPENITFGNPVVSLNAAQNNFVFANAQSLDASQYFIFVGALGVVEAQGPLGGAADVPNAANWKIQAVPLPAAGWLLACGAGLFGFLRRYGVATQPASFA